LLEGDRETSLAALDTAAAQLTDAEALYYLARTFARLGESDRAAHELGRVVDGGFWCHDAFARDPWLDTIRGRADVQSLFERARAQVERARAAFVRARGPQLIGRPVANPPRQV
jgi:hypothetical protein